MATYAIGDLQGCFDELLDLLDTINFDEHQDKLWFAGDLINRGPKSLACLRFVIDHSHCTRTVLGNHDLHCLAIAAGVRAPHADDTFDDILNSADSNELLTWYRQQPLLIHDEETRFTLVHAGLPPQWDMTEAMALAKETSDMLKSPHFDQFIKVIYGNQPGTWQDDLTGDARYRYCINAFTRLRYCTADGRLKLKEKGAPGSQTSGLIPWYSHPKRQTRNDKILFGHWSTVTLGADKLFKQWRVYPLDTGCLWGGKLTALRLEDEQWFSVASHQPRLNK